MSAELLENLFVMAIPLLAPAITAALKRILPSLPKLAVVIIQPLLGILVSVFTPIDPTTGAMLGASGVFVREGVDQTRKAARSLAAGNGLPRAGKNRPGSTAAG